MPGFVGQSPAIQRTSHTEWLPAAPPDDVCGPSQRISCLLLHHHLHIPAFRCSPNLQKIEAGHQTGHIDLMLEFPGAGHLLAKDAAAEVEHSCIRCGETVGSWKAIFN